MADNLIRRIKRPETLTAIGIIVAATGFLFPAFALRPISALLPLAMLFGLIALAAILLFADQRKVSTEPVPKPMAAAPGRVAAAFALLVGYALAVDWIGFYPSTLISVPLVAWLFGYRNPLGLAVATAIVVGGIWLIFGFAMAQDFPAGRLWSV